MQIDPYLFFDGRCDEAIEFYSKALGATTEMLMRYKDAPDQSMVTKGSENKVMHASLNIGGVRVLASDGHNKGNPKFEGFSLAITAGSEPEAERMFNALSAGGEVTMPLAKTFFSPKFGMLKDKFGVQWMVLVSR
ncbi:MAG TPA: VOC family protein [Pseudolabrys sp.]|jgi:PhnB protein|nr:VOC family protein [Pseudolabrys sp.]